MSAAVALPQINTEGGLQVAPDNRKWTYRAERVERWNRFYRQDPDLDVLLADVSSRRFTINRRAAALRALESLLLNMDAEEYDEGLLNSIHRRLSPLFFQTPCREFRALVESCQSTIDRLIADLHDAARECRMDIWLRYLEPR